MLTNTTADTLLPSLSKLVGLVWLFSSRPKWAKKSKKEPKPSQTNQVTKSTGCGGWNFHTACCLVHCVTHNIRANWQRTQTLIGSPNMFPPSPWPVCTVKHGAVGNPRKIAAKMWVSKKDPLALSLNCISLSAAIAIACSQKQKLDKCYQMHILHILHRNITFCATIPLKTCSFDAFFRF